MKELWRKGTPVRRTVNKGRNGVVCQMVFIPTVAQGRTTQLLATKRVKMTGRRERVRGKVRREEIAGRGKVAGMVGGVIERKTTINTTSRMIGKDLVGVTDHAIGHGIDHAIDHG